MMKAMDGGQNEQPGRKKHLSINSDWILASGCVLAFLVAAVNADFMLRIGISVSHLTGDLSRITSEILRPGGRGSRELAMICLSLGGFVVGAAIAGWVIHHPNLDLERPYGRFIMAIGGLLLATSWLLPHSSLLACGVAACACGMQNALATRYRGIVLRTTHITGLLTDLGQWVGMKLRGHAIESWKLSIPLLIALSFALGALGGAFVALEGTVPVTFVCGWLYVAGGATWSGIKRWL